MKRIGATFARLRGYLLVLALTLTLCPRALATNGMQLLGVGPVMRSMGGAGTALPLDAMNLTVNPAGLSKLGKRVDVGFTYFKPHTEYTATHHPAMPGLGGTTVQENTHFAPAFIPSMGYVCPVNDLITFGIAAYGVAGMGVDYDNSLFGAGITTSYSMMKLVPGVSYKITDNLALAVALNTDIAIMGYKAGGGPNHEKNTSLGFGFQLGLLYDVNDQLSLALTYISRQWFDEFEFDTPYGDETMLFDLPQQAAIGVGYKFNDRLRGALDLRWINWSGTMGDEHPVTPTNVTGQTFDMGWSDQFVIALGLEYDIIPAVLKGRVGYNYGKTPVEDERAFEAIAFPALTEHHFTAGLGWQVTENLTLNTGFMWAPTVEISGSQASQYISDYETSLNEYSLEFGFSYTWD